jgi:hypothetical protein
MVALFQNGTVSTHLFGNPFIKYLSLSDGITHDTGTDGNAVHSAFLEGRAPPKPVAKPVAPKPAAPKPAAPKPAAPKPPPTTPQPVKAPEFPKLPVPYLEDAVDLCDLYIECYEDVWYPSYNHLSVPAILTYFTYIGRRIPHRS